MTSSRRLYKRAPSLRERDMLTLNTRSAQPAEVENKWIVIDAEGAVVGRLASFIAMRLRGKHRADFTPSRR